MSITYGERRPTLRDQGWFRSMRDEHPVWRDPETGNWQVFRYADVARVLTDHDAFVSDFSRVRPEEAERAEGMLIATDLPRHRQLRGLVSKAFTPRTIAALEPRIREISDELLDQVAGQDGIEVVSQFSYPLPVTVIAELLGVPAADHALFRSWTDSILEEGQDSYQQMSRYLQGHVDDRRAHPRADLISDLVAADIDGERLTDREIANFAFLLLLAGHVTTTALLGNTLLCLDEHPQAQAALRTDPAAIPRALEEVLRYRSPVGKQERWTVTDVRLGEQTIPANSQVDYHLLSANHDERQFDRPEEFDIARDPNPHLGFGKGIHFCLGAPLARLEARVALEAILARYPAIRVDPTRPIEETPGIEINRVRALHLLVA